MTANDSGILQMVIAGDTNARHGPAKIEHHLEFYNESGEQLEHYGNTANAFIPPRKGERVVLGTRKLALDLIRVDHEFVEYGDFRIGHVIRVHGNQMPWFAT